MNKEDMCYWYKASKDQRATEIERNLGLEGTIGYEKMGCYECLGLNKDCKNYTNLGLEGKNEKNN